MSVNQPQRLSYTRRDLLTYHDDVTRLLKHFIPRITDLSEMNEGRLYLTIIEAMVDNANFSVDQVALEFWFQTAIQRKNILRASYLVGYPPSPVSAASVDATFSLISGVAGVGGYPIPIYSRVQTVTSPTYEFITMEAVVIPEGSSSVDVPAVQGVRVADEVLASSSDGTPNQKYKISSAKTPHIYIEVYVSGVRWDFVEDFADSLEEDIDYALQFDEDDYTYVIFGDGEFGKNPPLGSLITVSYIRTLADQGNASAGAVAKVIGSIASDVTATNTYAASGGGVSETNDSIKRNAPAHRRAFERVVTRFDYEAIATQYPGVYKAFANPSEGARTDIYLLPEGGGVASSLLISQVQAQLDSMKLEGALPFAFALSPASVFISVNIVTFDNRQQKSSTKSKVRQATLDNLDYTKLIRGRGFTISDLSGIYEALGDGKLVDYADFAILTRIPRVTQTNLSAPTLVGRVKFGTNAQLGLGYDTYLITALDATQFAVSKNGIPQTVNGVVGIEYTTDNNEIQFTLGASTDTLTAGDTWRFKTSKYADNMVIDPDEYMYLEKSSDLVISVFYPGEYNITTKSAT